MSDSVRLSIAIPVYNQASTICETVRSCLNQTVAAYEVVVCENHSTDNTLELLKSFGDRIRIVQPPQHLCMTENWNFAVRATFGNWVSLISGDDIAYPNFVEGLACGAGSERLASFVMGGWNVIDESGAILSTRQVLSLGRVTQGKCALKPLLLAPKASFCAFCFSRTAFDAVGGYPVEFNLIQDWMFQILMATQGAIVNIPQIISGYRTQNRPELEARRRPLYLADELTYVRVLIPRIEKCGLKARVISQQRRKRCHLVLKRFHNARADLTDEEHELIRELCALSGCNADFEKWRSGQCKAPVYDVLIGSIKRIMRQFYLWSRSSLR